VPVPLPTTYFVGLAAMAHDDVKQV
jgi:hypothetical protein